MTSLRSALRSSQEWCRKLGIPIAAHKTEGPVTSLVFLGIEINTVQLALHLLESKLSRLQDRALQHACCVVKPGWSFLRRMIDLTRVAKELHHSVRLNRGFRSDLRWWVCFLEEWNGSSMMTGVVWSSPRVVMTSDASES